MQILGDTPRHHAVLAWLALDFVAN